MKRVLMVLVLLGLLLVGASVYAADADGVWICTDQDCPLVAMSRVNGGAILFTVLDLFEGKMADWIPLFGPFDGTTGQLSLILTSQANGNIPKSMTGTFSLTSPTSATFTGNSCTNFPQQDNCGPAGTVLNFSKIF